MLPKAQRKAFQAMAHQVFTGRGRGIVEITTRAGLFDRPGATRRWSTASGPDPRALTKELCPELWATSSAKTGPPDLPPEGEHNYLSADPLESPRSAVTDRRASFRTW